MKKTVLREYAKLIAKCGANVQKGQDPGKIQPMMFNQPCECWDEESRGQVRDSSRKNQATCPPDSPKSPSKPQRTKRTNSKKDKI